MEGATQQDWEHQVSLLPLVVMVRVVVGVMMLDEGVTTHRDW